VNLRVRAKAAIMSDRWSSWDVITTGRRRWMSDEVGRQLLAVPAQFNGG
jgi:hypothetical protein